ncbi:MAG: polymerase delta prime subunit [Candidatus Parcubacteria bacterium]|jgi:DNA polymerase III gamma/tau subunit
MKPRIVISKRQDKLTEYVGTVIKDQAVAPYYVFEIRPVKTEITIDQVRAIKREIITATAQNKRLFVLYDMDGANLEAQNALLKTLEEKNEDNLFIMLASNAERVLPTIRSRSQLIDLDIHDRQLFTIRPETQAFLDRLKQSEAYSFMGEKSITGITRDEALLLLDEITVYYHTQFKQELHHLIPLIKKILQTKQLLQNNNLNPQLALDAVLINIKTNLKHIAAS